MKSRNEEILGAYRRYLNPIIGEGQLQEDLINGLENILSSPHLSKSHKIETEERLEKRIDFKEIYKIQEKLGSQKSAATRLINALHSFQEGREIKGSKSNMRNMVTVKSAIQLFNLGKGYNYGKVGSMILEAYLSEKGLIHDKLK